VVVVLLVVFGSVMGNRSSDSPQPDRPRPTTLLSQRSNGKPEAATAVVVAPDDGHEDARNMLSCI
jgi:hypothetical protein